MTQSITFEEKIDALLFTDAVMNGLVEFPVSVVGAILYLYFWETKGIIIDRLEMRRLYSDNPYFFETEMLTVKEPASIKHFDRIINYYKKIHS